MKYLTDTLLILSLILSFVIVGCLKKNRPPDKPSTPGGPSLTQVNDTCSFVTSASDPDGDEISYQFDWGDGSKSEWSNFVPNESPVTMSKSWSTVGEYAIKARAKDKKGAISDWSAELKIGVAPNYPPSTPVIIGPSTGYVNIIYTFTALATDPNGDSVAYQFDWGDGTQSNWSPLVPNGTTVTMSKSWSSPRNWYTVKAKAKDRKGLLSVLPAEHTLIIFPNDPPNTPSAPSGRSSGHLNVSYSFSTSTTDPDGDSVAYQFDWGDGTQSNWSEFKPSGTWITMSKSWSSNGTYLIKARAKDTKGAISNWSSGHQIDIGNKPPNIPSTPSGPSRGNINTYYTFSSSATDPEDDSIAIRFDWGDGDTSSWSSWMRSGSSVQRSKSWSSPGIYYVKAQAKDKDGAISSWSSGYRIEIEFSPPLKWRYYARGSSSPAIGSDGTIYFGSDNYLYALNPDGTLKWRYRIYYENLVYSPSVGSDGTIYFTNYSRDSAALYALNPNGTLRWQYPVRGFYYEVTDMSLPAIGPDGTVYFGAHLRETGYTWFYAVSQNGTHRWTYQLPVDDDWAGTPAIAADGTVYFGTEEGLYALYSNGTLRWFYRSSYVRTSPAIGSDGTIYFGTDNYLYALNPDGTLKWRYQTGSYVMSSPAIGSDGTIYFGSHDNYLYALNPDGTLKWRYLTDGYVRSSPAIGSDGTIYFSSDDGYLYAIQGSGQLANTPWPKFRHDLKNTGRVGGP
jgi:outer membrane protein assembly factor BamB